MWLANNAKDHNHCLKIVQKLFHTANFSLIPLPIAVLK